MEKAVWEALHPEDRFNPLKVYFEGLLERDLESLNEDELVDACEPKHRLLMKSFVRQCYKPWVAQHVRYRNTIVPEGSYDLSGRLCSSMYSSLRPDLLTIEQLSNDKAFLAKMRTVSAVLMTNSNLQDVDLPEIANLFKDLDHSNIILDLSGNRFHGFKDPALVDEAVKDLFKHIKFLVIHGNPFASSDRVDFFSTLSLNHARKLIWIPFPWVEAGKWRVLFNNHSTKIEIEECTLEVHRQFYTENDSFSE